MLFITHVFCTDWKCSVDKFIAFVVLCSRRIVIRAITTEFPFGKVFDTFKNHLDSWIGMNYRTFVCFLSLARIFRQNRKIESWEIGWLLFFPEIFLKQLFLVSLSALLIKNVIILCNFMIEYILDTIWMDFVKNCLNRFTENNSQPIS